MQSFLLQDWTTVGTNTATGVASVLQAAGGWLDLGFASEVLFFLEIAQQTSSSTTRIAYETAPLRDGTLFKSMAIADITGPTTSPTVTRIAPIDNPTQPISRWARWRAYQDFGTGVWNVTFRITAIGHPR